MPRSPAPRPGIGRLSLSGLLLACLSLAALLAPALASASRTPATCDAVRYPVRALGDAGAGPHSGTDETRTTPPNPEGPTLVSIGIHAIDIRDILPLDGSFHYRGYVRSSWCDPRLAFEGETPRIYANQRIDAIFDRIWTPQGYPSNALGNLQMNERVLRMYPDGSVVQDIDISLRLATHFDLRRFPFDTQRLTLQVESYLWDRDDVELVVDASQEGSLADLELPEWTLQQVSTRIDEIERKRAATPFSRYTMQLTVRRNPGFYIWKVFLPLVVIVAVSWSVFWMTKESFASRSRISATGILTIVAYQFVFAADLPRVGYLTILDRAMIGSFSLLAVTVVQSLLVTHTHETSPERAKRIDRASRWAFPAAYALMFAAILAA